MLDHERRLDLLALYNATASLMSPELESLALSIRRSACSRSAGVRAMPGRCTGGRNRACASAASTGLFIV